MVAIQFTLQPKTLATPTSTKPKIQHHPTTTILSFRTPFSFTQLLTATTTTTTTTTPLNVSPLRATSSYDNADFSSKRVTNTSNSGESRDTIMLPGCDYNHWLIVMDFPKDPSPTRDQMIDTYLNTLASVLGSMEEAKKNMYAFSTTTYTGFQCTVDEETSEKFKGLPGVLWVLPDSYIDVKNKDYGGDKYIDGEIIPCKYPTYQPKQRNTSKYESRRYERRRDGPPGSTTTRRSRQETTPSESASS